MKKKITITIIFSCIFCFGTLLRYYNHSYDDLWYDEVISFWVANPDFSLRESFNNNYLIEENNFTYNFILRFFFIFFGYSVETGRLLSVVLSSLSILTLAFLSWQIKKNHSFVFSAFLIGLNIFLISYSQEMRVYSMLFFFCSLSLIFFIRVIENKKSLINLLIFNLSNLTFLALHPFSIIIFFSYIIYLILLFYLFKKTFFYLYISLALSFLFFVFINYINLINQINNIVLDYYWFTQPTLKFYTNFYFSAFFGSRLMGIIFLIFFIFLIIINFKKIITSNYLSLLFLIFIFSYFIPLVYGYIFRPIFTHKYIIFVLISIILIISHLILETKNNKIKFFLIVFLSLVTIGNHFTEQSFKQFFKTRVVHKPEYTAAISFISDSNFKKYTLLVEKMKNNKITIIATNHYINYISKKNNLDVKYISQIDATNRINKQTLWQICFQDFNDKSCPVRENIKKFNILEEKNFNNINLKLLEIY